VINAAIIGLGWWGHYLLRTLQGTSDKIRIVRAIDYNPKILKDLEGLASATGVILSADMQDAFDDTDVQAVILTTPHSLHEAQIAQVAQAGKHVFCEKPLGLTKASAERSVAACQSAGVMLGIGHERRFDPALIEIKRMIDAGELGTILHGEANFSHDSLAGADPDNWRVSKEHAPAAGMTAMGIHLTDSYIHMLGPIDQVYAQTARRVVQSETGDVVSAHLRFESGVTAYLNSILATPFFMCTRIFGSDAWVEARDTVRPEAEGITYLTLCRAGGKPETRKMPSINTAVVNLETFADAISGVAAYPFTPEEMVNNIAVLEAITRSVESGEAERVP